MSDNAFSPDWTSSPGETVADILDERELSAAQLAGRLGNTLDEVHALLAGRAPLTAQLAQKLEAVFGASADFWLTREARYREELHRLMGDDQVQTESEWLSAMPVRDMVRFGWMPKATSVAEKITACLSFFGVPDVAEWRHANDAILQASVLFRTSPSFTSERASVSAWLRQGELQSAKIECQPWGPALLRDTIPDLRQLTRKHDPARFIPEVIKLCAACGVAVAIVRAPERCRASGATRFISPDRALLMLSFRYLSDDQFWFTFFHEVGHLLLHSASALFLEEEASSTHGDTEETEANEFAADVLIPKQFQSELANLNPTMRNVVKFAQRVGISPGIVVGQLQHRGQLEQSHLNSLKRRYNWQNKTEVTREKP